MCQHWDEDKETSDFPKSSFRGLNSRRQEAHGSPARNNVTRVKLLQKLLGPLILPLTSPLWSRLAVGDRHPQIFLFILL